MGGYDQSLLLAHSALGSTPHRCIAVSRPGYLGTPLKLGREPEQQADLCAAVLDTLVVEKAVVIAISGGGQTALQFALRHPARCRALIMISACSAQLHVRLPLRFYLVRMMAHFPGMVARMRSKVEAADAQRAAKCADPEAAALMRELQLSTMDRMRERMPGTLNDIRTSRAPFDYPLERVTVPTLVVHGTADEAAPFEVARSLASRVPNADFLPIDGGAHISLFTHLGLIRDRVSRFLAKLPSM